MLLPGDIFLALRYLRPKRTFVSFITLLTLCGPIFGVAFLIIVISIMTGFDKEIRTRLLNMQAHYSLYQPGGIQDVNGTLAKMRELGLTAAPVVEGAILIQRGKEAAPHYLRGIDPALENKVLHIDSSDVIGTLELRHGQVALGSRLAASLNATVGSKLLIHSPEKLARNFDFDPNTGDAQLRKEKEIYLPEEVRVVGIFETGVYDFDSNMVLIHISQAAGLFGYDWGTATSIHGIVADPFQMDKEVAALQAAFPYGKLITWQESNRVLFNALQQEKAMMFFVLSFIVLIAAFAICCVMITVVVQKTREVGILKAIGYTPTSIARIFLVQGLVFGILGAGLGTALGLFIVERRQEVSLIIEKITGREVFPPSLYHLNKIPAAYEAGDIAVIALIAVVLCTLAAVIPALYAASLRPAKALQEGA